MKKKAKKVDEVEENHEEVVGVRFEPLKIESIALVEFADVATLKDKLNEVITKLNG